MIRCIIPLLLLLFGSTSAAQATGTETFELSIRIRIAKELFDARRYRDAESAFEKIRTDHHPVKPHNIDSYMNVLDFLARSISQQGKTGNVLSLLEARHVLIARHYDSRGIVFANSMSRLAEALYREGNRSRALSFINYAINLYEALRPQPDEAISLAKSNRLQYKVAHFNSAMLPMDLSDFYTRCEQLSRGETDLNSSEFMSSYVEVGVDYLPEGKWVDYFDTLSQQYSHGQADDKKYRIYVPHNSERMRSELCFVVDKPDRVISAESELD